ncbi:hypothetical protein CDD83_588 [Cordyceps sp. RAO-2017]|nr:hypothetical protein CDD83_588 [Cordyceps sp. RAO-2017]
MSAKFPRAAVAAYAPDSAADSPPSPRSIRPPWKRQFERVSRLHRQRGHRVASSESSSLASMAGAERPPWELALENLSLARRSSTRSTGSSSPSRHRPESTRALGKILFHRRSRPKRNNARSHDSSASSVYSVDTPLDPALVGPREFLLPAFFARRKPPPSRDDAVPRKLQISGPFNFQHLAHRRREDHFAQDDSAHWAKAAQDPSRWRARNPSTSLPGSRGSLETGAPYCQSMFEQPAGPDSGHMPRPHRLARHAAPSLGPHRLAELAPPHDHRPETRSSSILGVMSPPASPTSASFSPASPPPRVSSRRPLRRNLLDAPHDVARPHTSGCFRRQQSLGMVDINRELPPLPPLDDRELVCEDDSSPSGAGCHEVTWPLPSPSQASTCEMELPNVPEEDEHGPWRRSRVSLVSARSSLRASHSVPTLRSVIESLRRTSVASETLGRPDVAAADGRAKTLARNAAEVETAAPRESWEDDIDYCYDHEAEADCNYQWERPSLDTTRDFDTPPASVAVMTGEDPFRVDPGRGIFRPTAFMSLPLRNLSALSPGSGVSVEGGHGATTPSPNPALDGGITLVESDARTPYSLEGEHDVAKSTALDFEGISAQTSGNPASPSHHRSSASTMTDSTCGFDSTEKRHMSMASSRTTLTRHTASNSSLNKMSSSWASDAEPLPSTNPADRVPTAPDVGVAHPVGDLVPDLTSLCGARLRKSNHKMHASESLVSEEPRPLKSWDASRPLRQRARTTSLSTQTPPPTGQYAIFPRNYIPCTGDQI